MQRADGSAESGLRMMVRDERSSSNFPRTAWKEMRHACR